LRGFYQAVKLIYFFFFEAAFFLAGAAFLTAFFFVGMLTPFLFLKGEKYYNKLFIDSLYNMLDTKARAILYLVCFLKKKNTDEGFFKTFQNLTTPDHNSYIPL